MRTVLSQVLLFSFFILIISGSYSSFTSLLNYIHKAHGQDHIWHAQVFFVINSLSCIFFNILIPNLKIKKLKFLTYTIPLSYIMIYVFTYLGFLTQNTLAISIFTILAAIISGIGSSTIWIVSGKYIHNACQFSDSKAEQGRFYGIFGGIMACSFFIGSILSATSMEIIQKKHDIYLVLTFVAILALIHCKFFIKDFQNSSQKLRQQSTDENRNKNQELIMSDSKNEENGKIIEFDFKLDKNCLFKNLSVYRKMTSLMPFQFLNGLTVGYIFHCSQDLIFAPSQQSKENFLTITLIFIGFGSAIGAYAAGRFSDKYNFKKVFLIGVTICLISYLLGIVSLAVKIQLVSLLTSFISGLGMMFTNNMLIVFCSKSFDGTMMVFAANRQVITISFMLFNLGINAISPENMHSQMYYELAIFIAIGLFCLYMIKYLKTNKYFGQNKGEQMNLNQIKEKNVIEMKFDSIRDSSPSVN